MKAEESCEQATAQVAGLFPLLLRERTDRAVTCRADPNLQLAQPLTSKGLSHSVADELVLGPNPPRQFCIGVRGVCGGLRATLLAIR